MRIYLTGASGFVGSNIVRVAQEKFNADVFAAVYSWQPKETPTFQYGRVDLCDRDAVMSGVRAFQPDVIIHSAIVSGLAPIYRDRHLAWRAYVESTHHLTDAANESGARIILISTDWVFDGTQAGATEATPPNPINYYGVLKVASERVVAERGKNWAVARTAGVNGVHWFRRDEPQAQNPGYGHFATAVLNSLQRGEPFQVWLGDNVNQRANPTLASDTADMILKIAQTDAQGIFHCIGGESIERMAFARRVAQTFDYDPEMIQPAAPPNDLPPAARIPADTSLDAQHTARVLNHRLLDVQDLLARYKRELEVREVGEERTREGSELHARRRQEN